MAHQDKFCPDDRTGAWGLVDLGLIHRHASCGSFFASQVRMKHPANQRCGSVSRACRETPHCTMARPTRARAEGEGAALLRPGVAESDGDAGARGATRGRVALASVASLLALAALARSGGSMSSSVMATLGAGAHHRHARRDAHEAKHPAEANHDVREVKRGSSTRGSSTRGSSTRGPSTRGPSTLGSANHAPVPRSFPGTRRVPPRPPSPSPRAPRRRRRFFRGSARSQGAFPTLGDRLRVHHPRHPRGVGREPLAERPRSPLGSFPREHPGGRSGRAPGRRPRRSLRPGGPRVRHPGLVPRAPARSRVPRRAEQVQTVHRPRG